MKKMTEQELTDKIRQVFDNFEDPAADHGWQELRKKYPENRPKTILLWWSSIAAALMIGCGLWFILPESRSQQFAGDTQRKTRTDSTSAHVNIPNNSTQPDGQVKAQKFDAKVRQLNSNPVVTSEKAKLPVQLPDAVPARDANPVSARHLDATAKENLFINHAPVSASAIMPLPVTKRESSATVLSIHHRDSLIESQARLLALAKPLASLDDPLIPIKEQPYQSRKTTTPSSGLSVYAGTFFNYSEGSESNVNFGAGFTSDIPLGNRWKLTTGLGLAKNNLNYKNGVPSFGNNKESLYDSPVSGLNPAQGSGNSLTTITQYNADLTNLDIPLNLKYMVIPEANKLYISAGLSSGIFISEKYSLNYRNYDALSGSYSSLAGITNEVKKELAGFDFVRTLNVSLGFSTRMGKTQSLSIEPFLKYPLGGLGSEQLIFGSSGVNLKFNFSTLKNR